MKKRFMLLLTIAVAFTMVHAGLVMAATKVKFAHVYETSEPYHKRMVEAAEIIKQRTEGRYEMEVFAASSLGKEVDINQGLALGTVDIIYTGNLFAGKSFGPLAIAGAPYMFRDTRPLAQIYHQRSVQRARGRLYQGHRQLYRSPHLLRSAPCDLEQAAEFNCADMKNLKIRVPNAPLYMMFPKACEANPTPIAFRRGVPGSAAGCRRCPGESAADHQGKKILRSAEVHQPDRTHLRQFIDHYRRPASTTSSRMH